MDDGRPFRIVAAIELPRRDGKRIAEALKLIRRQPGIGPAQIAELAQVAAMVAQALSVRAGRRVRLSITERELALIAGALIETKVDRGPAIHDEILAQVRKQYPAAENPYCFGS